MASNARKMARYLDRLSQGKIATSASQSKKITQKELMLENIKRICGDEYRLQMQEGKAPTPETIFEAINRNVWEKMRSLGITDDEVRMKIKDGIENKPVESKLDKAFKTDMKVIKKLMPNNVQDKIRNQMIGILRESASKRYFEGKTEGKTMDVEEVYNSMKIRWAGKSSLNMVEQCGMLGITEDDIRQTIREAIDAYR